MAKIMNSEFSAKNNCCPSVICHMSSIKCGGSSLAKTWKNNCQRCSGKFLDYRKIVQLKLLHIDLTCQEAYLVKISSIAIFAKFKQV